MSEKYPLSGDLIRDRKLSGKIKGRYVYLRGKTAEGREEKENTIWRTKIFAAHKKAIAIPLPASLRAEHASKPGYFGLVGACTSRYSLCVYYVLDWQLCTI